VAPTLRMLQHDEWFMVRLAATNAIVLIEQNRPG
jgi:hypothetical protein